MHAISTFGHSRFCTSMKRFRTTQDTVNCLFVLVLAFLVSTLGEEGNRTVRWVADGGNHWWQKTNTMACETGVQPFTKGTICIVLVRPVVVVPTTNTLGCSSLCRFCTLKRTPPRAPASKTNPSYCHLATNAVHRVRSSNLQFACILCLTAQNIDDFASMLGECTLKT